MVFIIKKKRIIMRAKKNWMIFGILCLIFLVLGPYLLNEYKKFNNLVAPHVFYNNTEMSGKTSQEVASVIAEDIKSLTQDIKISTQDGKTIENVNIKDMDWSFNSTTTAQKVMNANHNFNQKGIKKIFSDIKSILNINSSPVNIQLQWSFNRQKMGVLIHTILKKYQIEPVNASITYKNGKIEITPDTKGSLVDEEKINQEIFDNLSKGTRKNIILITHSVEASITTQNLPKVIVVNQSQRKIYLYGNDGILEKTYRCAVGTSRHPTPFGDFKVIRKLYNSPWVNPGSDWAKNMPSIIPAGPYNPMGIHKIGINVPGIYFHGIPPSEFNSIGTAASHGCMRMMPKDVEDLYQRVPIGTLVFIR